MVLPKIGKRIPDNRKRNSVKTERDMLKQIYQSYILCLRDQPKTKEERKLLNMTQINLIRDLAKSGYSISEIHGLTKSDPKTITKYSERQVIRLFNKYCGKSFSDILLDIRMKKAVELLRNPSLSTTKIAEMLGFSSKSYFIRVFRKYYGKEPDGYR